MMQYIGYMMGGMLLLLVLAGCGGAGGESGTSGSPLVPEAVTDSVADEHSGPDRNGEVGSTAEEGQPEQQQEMSLEPEEAINDALSVIPGAGELADAENGLFLLKDYGADMGWSEANQLENLERGTPHNEVGPNHRYFLLLPKYEGARVEVNRLAYTGEGVPYLGESLYLNTGTPRAYGLVITSAEPEGMPDLAVTVGYPGMEYTYRFSYDGRGDRPAVQVFTADDPPIDSGGFFGYVWTSEGRELQATYPSFWTGDGPHFSFHTEVDGTSLLYQATIWPLKSGDLEHALNGEGYNEFHSLELTDGRTCLYVLVEDSPIKYIYALEVDGMIQLVQVYCIPGADEPNPILYPPTEVDGHFQSMLESIRLLGRS